MGRPKGSKNKPKVSESTPSITEITQKNIEYASSPVKQHTAAEMKEWYEKNVQNTRNAFKQIRDVTKTTRQSTLNSYSKDNVISYLQNISSNENNLRNLSRYLFYRSQVYFRLIMYNATMFDLNARTVIPTYDPTKNNNPNKMLICVSHWYCVTVCCINLCPSPRGTINAICHIYNLLFYI